MIMADKIIALRKKAGWSQEELAEQLNVSRQSVSKWEGAQSIPDMERVLQMSRLFGVTTDYLLKDEIEEAVGTEPAVDGAPAALRRVTVEEASAYLTLRKAAAPKIALATLLCILSPIALLLLCALSESPTGAFRISEGAAAAIGLAVLFVLVAAGVALFLSCGFRSKTFDFLDKEPFETAYGVDGMVRERKKAYQGVYARLNIVGTVLCILAVVPLLVVGALEAPDTVIVAALCLLLFLVGCGCFAFVYGGTYHAAMERLLEEGDYTRSKKAKRGVVGAISTCYWLIVTAIYLGITFGPYAVDPSRSWLVFAVGGILYGAVMAVVGLLGAGKDK